MTMKKRSTFKKLIPLSPTLSPQKARAFAAPKWRLRPRRRGEGAETKVSSIISRFKRYRLLSKAPVRRS